MRQEPQMKLATAGGIAAAFDGRTEAALVLAERAFDLPALAEAGSGKPSRELAAIEPARRLATGAPDARGNQAPCPEPQPDQHMVGLAVVACVGQELFKGHPGEAVLDGLGEVPVVRGGTLAHHPADIQVAARVAQGGELGKTTLPLAATLSIVHAGVAVFVAGGVEGYLPAPLAQHPRAPGLLQRRAQHLPKGVFFSSRFSAFATVE